jgi:cytochrome c553
VLPTGPPLIVYCASCHGDNGGGRSPLVPAFAGQSEPYLRATLTAFAQGNRLSGFMMLAASVLKPHDIADLAKYYAALPEAPRDRRPTAADLLARGRQIAEAGIPETNVPACSSRHGAAGRNPIYPTLDGRTRSGCSVRATVAARRTPRS